MPIAAADASRALRLRPARLCWLLKTMRWIGDGPRRSEAANDMHGGLVNVLLAIGVPLSAAFALMASETLTSPAHAERHSRARHPAAGWDRFERISGCVLGLLIAAVIVGAFVYLWSVKPSF